MRGVTLLPESKLDRTSAGGQRHQSWPSLCTIPLRLWSHPSLLPQSWRRSPPPTSGVLLYSPPLLACFLRRSSSCFLPSLRVAPCTDSRPRRPVLAASRRRRDARSAERDAQRRVCDTHRCCGHFFSLILLPNNSPSSLYLHPFESIFLEFFQTGRHQLEEPCQCLRISAGEKPEVGEGKGKEKVSEAVRLSDLLVVPGLGRLLDW